MDILLLTSVLSLILAIICLYSIFYLRKGFNARIKSVETQLESAEFVISELKGANDEFLSEYRDKDKELKEWQLEHQQVGQQLEHRIKVLQELHEQTKNELSQLSHQQPEDKLYQRAQKLVSLGAEIEEIMQECDLPHAEAEILISMHRRNSTK